MTKNESFGKVSGFIDKGSEVTGDIKFKDSFRIDGKFKGKILSGVSLIIGESGEVEADISVDNISINGKFKGSVDAKTCVEVFAKGKVSGTCIFPGIMPDGKQTGGGKKVSDQNNGNNRRKKS